MKKEKRYSFTRKDKMQYTIDDIDDYDRWTNHDYISIEHGLVVKAITSKKSVAKDSIERIKWWIGKTDADIFIMQEINNETCANDSNGEDIIYGFILAGIKYSDIEDRDTKITAAVSEFYYSDDVTAAMVKNFKYVISETKEFLKTYKKEKNPLFIEGSKEDSFVPTFKDNIITPPSAKCSGWIDIESVKSHGGGIRIMKTMNTEYATNAAATKYLDTYAVDVFTAPKTTSKSKKEKARFVRHIATGVKVEDLLALSEQRPDIISKSQTTKFMTQYLTK